MGPRAEPLGSSTVVGGGSGDQSLEPEASQGGDERVLEGVPRATEEAETVGVAVQILDPHTAVGGSKVIGSGSGGAGASGVGEDYTGLSRSPPRDSAKGKGVVTEEEQALEAPFEYREEDVLFRPTATSSGHRPITKHDIAKYLSDEALASFLRTTPPSGC